MLCGSESSRGYCLCDPCLAELPHIEHARSQCGNPTIEPQAQCGQCISESPENHMAVSILHYQSPVDYLIQNMKYNNQLEIADLLGKLLVNRLKTMEYQLPETIIPVPLHIGRLQQRGYNQAVEIARPVSKALKIPLDLTSCIRSRLTEPQVDLSHTERRNNLKNAFEVVHQIKAKHVAIIDDVMTSGSTLNACSKTLIEVGAKAVFGLTVARAVLNNCS